MDIFASAWTTVITIFLRAFSPTDGRTRAAFNNVSRAGCSLHCEKCGTHIGRNSRAHTFECFVTTSAWLFFVTGLAVTASVNINTANHYENNPMIFTATEMRFFFSVCHTVLSAGPECKVAGRKNLRTESHIAQGTWGLKTSKSK